MSTTAPFDEDALQRRISALRSCKREDAADLKKLRTQVRILERAIELDDAEIAKIQSQIGAYWSEVSA